jgi:hypothetical protein
MGQAAREQAGLYSRHTQKRMTHRPDEQYEGNDHSRADEQDTAPG